MVAEHQRDNSKGTHDDPSSRKNTMMSRESSESSLELLSLVYVIKQAKMCHRVAIVTAKAELDMA